MPAPAPHAPPPLALTPLAFTPLALTMGDPAGIGLEITLKAWLARTSHNLQPFCFYGDADALAVRAKALRVTIAIEMVSSASQAIAVFDQALPVLHMPTSQPPISGQPEAANAEVTIGCITRAVADVAAGQARAVVTNPIAKSVLYGAGFKHPGHTEFLAALAEQHWPGQRVQPVMMLACDALRVVPLTIHVPIAAVPALVTTELIVTTVHIMDSALKRDFGITSPRIAVAGLNPHSGEDGSIGREDRDIIAPALCQLRAEGFDVTGPLPADTMFHSAMRPTYDAALCMYHDQALIPIKTLAFDQGVNVTLGLPFVRTSPDHGTAFGIAGQGIASATSLIEALKLADRLTAAQKIRV
jgi:4-hydroxythreonine-4-phosphate dehydrogenase